MTGPLAEGAGAGVAFLLLLLPPYAPPSLPLLSRKSASRTCPITRGDGDGSDAAVGALAVTCSLQSSSPTAGAAPDAWPWPATATAAAAAGGGADPTALPLDGTRTDVAPGSPDAVVVEGVGADGERCVKAAMEASPSTDAAMAD